MAASDGQQAAARRRRQLDGQHLTPMVDGNSRARGAAAGPALAETTAASSLAA